jgi:hypothetical protein
VAYAGKSRLVLLALRDMLQTITGTQDVFIGIPESYASVVSVSISAGDRTPIDKAAGYHETAVNFYLEFAYAVENAEAAAEQTLADWQDGLEDAWLADRQDTGGTLGGLVRSWELDYSLQADPRFRRQAGDEVRLAPVLVRTIIPRG